MQQTLTKPQSCSNTYQNLFNPSHCQQGVQYLVVQDIFVRQGKTLQNSSSSLEEGGGVGVIYPILIIFVKKIYIHLISEEWKNWT